MKFLSKLEKQPWGSEDSSPSGKLAAFALLIAAVFIIPFVSQKLLGDRLTLPDVLLFSSMPGICAYGFFIAKKVPFKLLSAKEFFSCASWGLLVILISGCATFVWETLLTLFNIPFEKEQFAFVLIRDSRGMDLVKLFFGLCIFTPLIEELLFRRIIYGFFLRWGYGSAFFATALLFSFCHFFTAGLPGLFILGIGFQFAYLKYRNLSAAVLMHAMVNSFAFMGALGGNGV